MRLLLSALAAARRCRMNRDSNDMGGEPIFRDFQ
jgi:hypothetical protein